MEQKISIPSINPADTGSEAGVLEFMQKKLLSRIEKIAPAKVISYDRNKNRAVVQILPLEITSTGEKLQRRQLVNISVLTLSGGGFWFSFPVKEGDVGWIVAADRDISVFKQQLSEYAPNTYRKHKYDDSFFIPDRINNFTIAEEDSAAVLISSVDGTTKVSIKDGQVTITAQKAEVKAQMVDVSAQTAIITAETTNNGNVIINGNLQVTGTVTSAGISSSAGISASADISGAGISLSGHVHGGVQGGSGTTGPAQ